MLALMYGKVFNDNDTIKFSQRLLQGLLASLDYKNSSVKSDASKDDNISVFTGVGAIIYLTYNFYKVIGDEFYIKKCKETMKNILETYKEKEMAFNDIDFLTGISSTLFVISKIILNETIEKELLDLFNDVKLLYINTIKKYCND